MSYYLRNDYNVPHSVRVISWYGGAFIAYIVAACGYLFLYRELMMGFLIHGELFFIIVAGLWGVVWCAFGMFASLFIWCLSLFSPDFFLKKFLLKVLEFFVNLAQIAAFAYTFFFWELAKLPIWEEHSAFYKSILILFKILFLFIKQGFFVFVYFILYFGLFSSVMSVPSSEQVIQTFSGTGSMYPTIPKGKGTTLAEQRAESVGDYPMYKWPRNLHLFGYTFPVGNLVHGDIVSFRNEWVSTHLGTRNGSFVKRVIGIPGDRLQLRNGIVYRNGLALKEPYVALPQSSFGGEGLIDCRDLVVPSGKLFVLGDNRLNSLDSRFELGLIDERDVDYVIPWRSQIGFLDTYWHDPVFDLDEQQALRFDAEVYLMLLNEKRSAQQFPLLRFDAKLTRSAQLRGEKVLFTDDFSFEATQSGYPMKRSMQDAGYWNPVYGEVIYPGYMTPEDLIEGQFGEMGDGDFFLDEKWDDVGISQVRLLIEGCPIQAVVIHLAGYVPATYDVDMVASWETALVGLREVYPGWERLKNTDFYTRHSTLVDELLNVYRTRIDRIGILVERFRSRSWLSVVEESYIDEDKILADRADRLAREINDLIVSGK